MDPQWLPLTFYRRRYATLWLLQNIAHACQLPGSSSLFLSLKLTTPHCTGLYLRPTLQNKAKCWRFRQYKCSINGCTIKHHKLLHNYVNDPATSSSQKKTFKKSSNTRRNKETFLEICRSGFINTYSFIDEDSSVPLINKDVFNFLDKDDVQQLLHCDLMDTNKMQHGTPQHLQ
uniref:Uncharacterized protein n=1 Tax=Glossina pallidipes TaxID=7398 RepID=A0A1A9ZLH2_GLOPL